ncbi:MAG TPA: hypothetical protein VJV78_16140 [Polyangiales bacterium]|nr:hypothetical protein [Polyangiales bacterium]
MLTVQSAPDAVGPATARFETRYEDLTQDGHVKLTALPQALGRACFGQLWAEHPLSVLGRQGVQPILSRLSIEIEPVAARLMGSLEGRGGLTLAHERDAAEHVSAIFLNAHADVWALGKRKRRPEASTPGVRSRGSALGVRDEVAKPVRVGRVFGEHVFTRPHAPRAERKVLAFAVPGYPELPSQRYQRPSFEQTVQLPDRARALEDAFTSDVMPWAFGLTHTDGNQHVNSLAYIKLFEDAALRRLASLGRPLHVLARGVEVHYRKPAFAGQQLQCVLRAFATRDGDGVVGYLAEPGAAIERAHCSLRMLFTPPPTAATAS